MNEVDFIERFGLLAEEDGMPRIAGRIFALLMLTEDPVTLDEIAEELQVSKASASTNTRLLDRIGILERTTKPGDRRTFYQLSPHALEASFDRSRSRLLEVLDILDGYGASNRQNSQLIQARLEGMRQWHKFMLSELEQLLTRWSEREKNQ